MNTCPNCSTVLENHFVYCPACGQTTDLPRFKIRHILDELFQAFFSVDRSVLSLIKNLTIRPGYTAHEYILNRKRKKYYNPFAFLLLVLGLNITVNALVKPYSASFSKPKSSVQQVKPTVPKDFLPYVERRRQAVLFIEENINFVGLAAIPVFAFVFWLCFRRTGINYAEHLVAQVFFASFFSLVSILLTLLLGLVLPHYLSFLNRSLLVFQLVYLTVAYYQFLEYRSLVGYLRTGVTTVLALVSWIAFSGGLVSLYIRFGG
jgi:hypothetical protein